MWKKDEVPTQSPAAPRSDPAPRPERSASSPVHAERATIGRSIAIKGEVTGDEDLLIQGRVDGSVDLKQHAVTVGPDGEVKASIIGRVVTIEGKVEGDLSADEQVILRSSASVQGDITAPRVVLEDGARFRGGVDMGEPADRAKKSGSNQGNSRKGESARAAAENVEASSQRAKSMNESPAEVKS